MTALSDQESPAQASWAKRFFFWIMLLLLLAAPFVVTEFYLRSIGLGNPTLYYGNTSFRYAPRPNQKHVGQRGAAITIDSKGLRGVKEWTAPADGKMPGYATAPRPRIFARATSTGRPISIRTSFDGLDR